MDINTAFVRQFFDVTNIGIAFYVLDRPADWENASGAEKEELLDYIFANERLAFCNQAYLTLSGATEEDIINKVPSDFFAFYPDVGKALWTQLLDEKTQPISAYEIMPGSWITGRNQCLYDDTGRFIGHVSTIVDISASYNIRNISHDLGLKQVSTYEYCIAPDGAQSYPYIGDDFADIFGISPEAVRRDASLLGSVVHHVDAQRIHGAYMTSRENLSVLEIEFRIRHPEKGVRWIKNTAVPERTADGRTLWKGYFSDITESKKSEEWIEFLNTALMNISDAVIITDKFGEIIYANRRVQEVHGYAPEELIGKSYEMMASPMPEGAVAELLETIGAGKTYSGVNTSRRKDGSIFNCEFELTCVYDEKSASHALISIQRDITDRLNMMEALRQSNERFEQLTKQSRTIAWETDQRGILTYISKASLDVLGYTPKEVVGRISLYDLLADGACSAISELVKKRQQFSNISCRVRNKAGGTIEMLINGIPFTDDAGEFKGYRGLGADITEKTMMEQAIKDEEERYRTTLLSVGDGVISTDAKGLVTVMNPVAEMLTGWTQQEAVGRPLFTVFSIIDEQTKKPCQNPVNIVLKTGESYKSPGMILLVSKTGIETPIENNAAPIKNSNGQITGVVIVFRDFSTYRDRQKKIEYLSFHDPLTDLYNRRYMEDAIVASDRKDQLPLTVMVVDVNGLKLTNDAFGHKMGDNLLITVARVLKEACKQNATIARMGGDEFMVVLPRTSAEKAEIIKQRIIRAAAAAKLESIIVSLAIGYAVKEQPEELIENTIKAADNAMYREKLRFGKTMRSQTIETVLRNINYKFDREQLHTERVSQYCEGIARAMHFHEREIGEIKIAGALHDIGKIIIPQEILNKPEKLTKEELAVVKKHPETGYQILRSSDEYANLAEYVLYHHEWWDGGGYPQGLKGEEIPLQARIIAVADAYEAMTSMRPYQKAKTADEAKAELLRCAGGQFDPEIVSIFVNQVLG
jgi:diguanylate cyclase (GGDEF)-like protein/PAS domain S-box-containing protein